MNIENHKLGEELDSFNYKQEQDAILAILNRGNNVLLDMTSCTYVSSTGLRVLLYSKKVAASQGLNLYLVGLNEEVKDIMDTTGFDHFFDYFDTVEECLEKVGGK
ncbi:MAG: STAS domain-containing protein [Bacteroidaceae bacterium]|nr:STAS domain-containing protein [Bacteroidaceae bacterium]